MTFLKKLGAILAKGAAVLTGISPFFPQYEGQTAKARDILDEILDTVVKVEAFSAALAQPVPGPEKLKAASPIVAQLILKSNLLTNKKISNPTLFQEGVAKVTNGMVDILNSIDPNEVKQ